MAGKKRKSQGGFTLVEMLIVVAVIAILIAVSIPMVTSTLEKSRVAVDQANERDAKGLAAVWYLTASQQERDIASNRNAHPYELLYWIDPDTHQGYINPFKADAPHLKYGLSTEPRGDSNVSPKGKCVMITMDSDGKIIRLDWMDSSSW